MNIPTKRYQIEIQRAALGLEIAVVGQANGVPIGRELYATPSSSASYGLPLSQTPHSDTGVSFCNDIEKSLGNFSLRVFSPTQRSS